MCTGSGRDPADSSGSTLGPEGHSTPYLAQAPKFLIGSIVISRSHCCLPNDEGPGPKNIFPRTATGPRADDPGGGGNRPPIKKILGEYLFALQADTAGLDKQSQTAPKCTELHVKCQKNPET